MICDEILEADCTTVVRWRFGQFVQTSQALSELLNKNESSLKVGKRLNYRAFT